MTDALRAEWAKLRTLTSTVWLLTGAVTLAIGVTVAVLATTHQSPGSGNGQDPTKLALTGIDLGQAVIAVIAVLVISEEYGTGMIRTTLAAIPRRLTMLSAKAANDHMASASFPTPRSVPKGGSATRAHRPKPSTEPARPTTRP
jgi:ABC-2 type transport system permease protein